MPIARALESMKQNAAIDCELVTALVLQ